MILFYNSKLEELDIQQEVSFSYNKKAKKEGSGRLELLNMPPKDSVYIIIIETSKDDNYEHIASGYIDNISEQKNNVIQLGFKTFEGVFKSLRLPRTWHCYENWTLDKAIIDLLFQNIPTYYTTRETLFAKPEPTNTKESESTNTKPIRTLAPVNIAYENIEGACLTLAFDDKKKEENTYYYCTQGSIIYILDFGCETTQITTNYKKDNGVLSTISSPTRVLRYGAQEGEKTFIYWKAIESDNDILNDDIERTLNKAPLLYFRRDIKDYAKNSGVALPSTKRYVFLKLIMRYKSPDYNNDFNTQDINISTTTDKNIIRRTVRGFTPILHGFEVIKKRAINPLENAQVHFAFSDIKDIRINNLQLENISLLEALEKLQEKYRFDIAFDLRLQKDFDSPIFYISVFRKEELGSSPYYGVDRRWDVASLLRENQDVITCNNFNISLQKKTLKPPYLLYVEGKGDSFNATHITFFIDFVVVDGNELPKISLIKDLTLSMQNSLITELGLNIIKDIPTSIMLREERVEFKDIKTTGELIKKAIEYISDKEKKKDNFEITIFNSARIYDKVRVLSSKQQKSYDALILEEKISKKDNKFVKSVALDSSFFNPFDIFFRSKNISPLTLYPPIPISLKITSHGKILNVSWEALGVYDDFTIKIKRCDKRQTFGFECEKNESAISIFTQGSEWIDEISEAENEDAILPIVSYPVLPLEPSLPPSNNEDPPEPVEPVEPVEPPSIITPEPPPSHNDNPPPPSNPNEPPSIITPTPPQRPPRTRAMTYALPTHNENIKATQNNTLTKRKSLEFPVQYIITKNTQIEFTHLNYNTLYEISVASNLKNKKSNYCIPIVCKIRKQSRHIKHVNSLEALQGEDGDIVFYLDLSTRSIENIETAFNHFEWCSNPLDYNSLTSFFKSQRKNSQDSNSQDASAYEECQQIYNTLSDDEKYNLLAPYGLYYIWKKGNWMEERLQPPACLAYYFEWRASALKPIYSPQEKQAYDTLMQKVEHAQNIKKELHKIYALYYHNTWEHNANYPYDSKALASPNLLKEFPPNAEIIENISMQSNATYNSSSIENPPPSTDPPPPELPPTNPPNTGIVTPDPSLKDIKRTMADKAILEERDRLVKSLKDALNEIANCITDNNNLFKTFYWKECINCLKHILNSKDTISKLDYSATNFEFLHNESYDNQKDSTNGQKDSTKNNSYIPITKRKHITHFLGKAMRFKYRAYDNGLVDYINKACKTNFDEPLSNESYSITPKLIINEPLPAINIQFDKTKKKDKREAEFTFSTYIKIEEAYGNVELWNIEGLSIGYYTYENDKGTLHFASLDNTSKVETITGEEGLPSEPMLPSASNNANNNAQYTQDIYKYKDYYTYEVEKKDYIHVMVLVRCKAEKRKKLLTEDTFYYVYAITQDIYIDYNKVLVDDYIEQEPTHTTFFHKPLDTQCPLKLFDTALMPKRQVEYDIKENYGADPLMPKYSICDKSEHGYTHYRIILAQTLLFTKYLAMEERLYLKEIGTHPISNLPKESIDDNVESHTTAEQASGHSEQNLDTHYLGVALKTPTINENQIHTSNSNRPIYANIDDFFLQHINSEPFKAGVLYKWIQVETSDNTQNSTQKKGRWKELLPYQDYPSEYYVAFKEFDSLMSLLPKETVKSFAMIGFLISNTIFTGQLIVNKGVFREHIIAPNLPNSDPKIKGALYRSGANIRISDGIIQKQ